MAMLYGDYSYADNKFYNDNIYDNLNDDSNCIYNHSFLEEH